MPDMDGYALFQHIREQPLFSTTPILFLSCMTEYEAEAKGLEMGAADYITKPFNPHIVRLRVRNHLLIKQQQDELYQEQELFSSGPVVSIVWDPEPDWPVRRVSSNIQEVLGYSPAEILDSDFRYASIIHPDDLERVISEVSSSIKLMRDSFEQSYRLKLKLDGYKWFYDFTRLERNDSGTITAIRGYIFDQSKLKQAEEAAESANRAKTEFLNNMSHELRTPLNGIFGMTQLLQFTDLTEEQSEFLESINLSVSTLTNIITDILDITKLETDQIELESAVFSLDTLLQDVIATQWPLVHQKGLTLISDIATNLPQQLIGDPKRITQILQNLLGNAVKFTNTGCITVEVEVVVRVPKQVQLRISIRDTGIGMTPDVMQRIFMPFVQADTSTTRRFGGTGLGLSISRKLAKLMGGTLLVESESGIGSSFHLELPFSHLMS
jgi:signal transduction histidine kinase